ncbi:MAG: hypothetical protein ACRDLM_03225 [Gaiellaceae bacterium]
MSEDSIAVWALLDANGEAVYSSNVLENVEAELERRVASDPRLRRILRIAEQTLTFHPRDEPEPDAGEPQSVCVLPWLPLDEPVRMGPLVFDHWSQVRDGVSEPARSTASQLLSHFQSVRGDEIDPAVCFYADRHPTHRLSDDAREFIRTSVFFLALAGLAENTYMHMVFEPMNAAHARQFFLYFHAARAEVHTIRRRREGGLSRGGARAPSG